MIPALQMIASSGGCSRIAATQARTDAGSDSSQATGTVLPVTLVQAVAALSALRAAPTTVAPRRARQRPLSIGAAPPPAPAGGAQARPGARAAW